MKKRISLMLVAVVLMTNETAYTATTFSGQTNQQINFGGTPQPVSVAGSVTVTPGTGTFTVSGALTDAQLRASPVPVSASSLPLPTGAATESTLSTLNSKVTAVDTDDVTITAPLPAGSNSIGAVTFAPGALVSVAGSTVAISGMPISNGVPINSRVVVTNTSGLLLAANPWRKGLECDSDCDGNKRVFIKWGNSAATSSDKRLESCSSWTPPTVSTVAVQAISESGTQGVVCIEY